MLPIHKMLIFDSQKLYLDFTVCNSYNDFVLRTSQNKSFPYTPR